jgi:hypothetical protein
MIDGQRLGAYGLAIEFPGRKEHLGPAPTGWQNWRFAYDVDPSYVESPEEWGPSKAALRMLPTGTAFLDRDLASTTFSVPAAPSAEAFAHPHLGSTAVAVGQWSGNATFHASSFVHDDGVWGVLGGKEDGKSSTIAWLHLAGIGIMSDDLLVASRGVVFAGPRCLDLREGAAEHFGIGGDIGEVGSRRRWRVPLPRIVAELPLRGWVSLGWGDKVTLRPCDAKERFAKLLENRAFLLSESSPASWLDLLGLPMFQLRRPRNWSCMDEAMASLISALAVAR